MKPIAQILDALRRLREAATPPTADDQARVDVIHEALAVLEEAELSHDEIRRNLSAAVKAGKPSGNGFYCWVRDVFDDHLVYEEETPTGGTLWQQSYTIDDAGKVTLGTEVTKVKVATTYVAISEAAETDAAWELLERAFSSDQRKIMAKAGTAMSDGSFPIATTADLKNAIQALGRASDPAAAKTHIKKRAKALGATSLLPADWTESSVPRETDELEEAELVGEIVPLVEKAVRKDGSFPIRIIAPGWGTSGYYSEAVIKRDIPKVYPVGTHMHFDHPTVSEARERPERSIKTIAAVTTSKPVWNAAGPAGPGMYAEAKARTSHQADIEELAPHIGVSIVASGHRKTGVAEGKKGPVIERIDSGQSIDFVTQAGAGGQVISLFEAARGRASSEPITEVDEVSEQELKEARDAATAAEGRATAAEAETARLREGAVLREARDVVAAALAKVEGIPDITRERLLEAIAKNPPTKEGALDKDALATKIDEAVKAEAAYLAKITGSGQISGMGGGAGGSEAAVKESEARLATALGRGFSLTEAETKQAVVGRSN